MKPYCCLFTVVVIVTVPAAFVLEDADFTQVPPPGADQGSSRPFAGSHSGSDVVIAKEGASVSLECLLTVAHYEDVHWNNSKGQYLDGKGNCVRVKLLKTTHFLFFLFGFLFNTKSPRFTCLKTLERLGVFYSYQKEQSNYNYITRRKTKKYKFSKCFHGDGEHPVDELVSSLSITGQIQLCRQCTVQFQGTYSAVAL